MRLEVLFALLAEQSPNSTKSPASGKNLSLNLRRNLESSNSKDWEKPKPEPPLKPLGGALQLIGSPSLTLLPYSLQERRQQQLLKAPTHHPGSNIRVLVSFRAQFCRVSTSPPLRWAWIVAAIPLGIAGHAEVLVLWVPWWWLTICLLSLSLSLLRLTSILNVLNLLLRMLLPVPPLLPMVPWSEDATKATRFDFDTDSDKDESKGKLITHQLSEIGRLMRKASL